MNATFNINDLLSDEEILSLSDSIGNGAANCAIEFIEEVMASLHDCPPCGSTIIVDRGLYTSIAEDSSSSMYRWSLDKRYYLPSTVDHCCEYGLLLDMIGLTECDDEDAQVIVTVSPLIVAYNAASGNSTRVLIPKMNYTRREHMPYIYSLYEYSNGLEYRHYIASDGRYRLAVSLIETE